MTHSQISWGSLFLSTSCLHASSLFFFLHLYFSVFPSLPLPALPGLPSFQAWLNDDNMFWGDKQAHAASEGSLGKAMVLCTLAFIATRGPDKSSAVGSRDCLHHTVFRDIRCFSQCRWSLRGWMVIRAESCTTSEQVTEVIYKRWHRRRLDASLHHGGTTGHGSIYNLGEVCSAQRYRLQWCCAMPKPCPLTLCPE